MSNPVLAVISRIKAEAKLRKLKKAINTVQAEGLSVVRLKSVDGRQYIQTKSGNWIRVGKK